MALHEGQIEIGDVARELCLDTLEYFARLENSGISPSTFLSGKFVRLQNLIVIAPLMRVYLGPFEDILTHRDLMMHGCDDMGEEFAQRRLAAPDSEQYLHKGYSLVDAGHYQMQIDDSGQTSQFTLGGESIEFGRPGVEVRQKTGELARLALGDFVPVTVDNC